MCWENLGEFSVARWETPDPGLEDGRVRPEKLPWTGAGPGSFETEMRNSFQHFML